MRPPCLVHSNGGAVVSVVTVVTVVPGVSSHTCTIRPPCLVLVLPVLPEVQELLMPMLVLSEWLTSLAQWEEPIKTSAFLMCSLYIIYK